MVGLQLQWPSEIQSFVPFFHIPEVSALHLYRPELHIMLAAFNHFIFAGSVPFLTTVLKSFKASFGFSIAVFDIARR